MKYRIITCTIIILLFGGCATLPVKRGYLEEGLASWYGSQFANRKTASGEIYYPHGLTAAHRTLPFQTQVKVTNLENGKSIIVRINDRGPFKEGRIIDLSYEAAKRIDMIKKGICKVSIELVKD